MIKLIKKIKRTILYIRHYISSMFMKINKFFRLCELDYGFVLKPRYRSDYGRAYTRWDTGSEVAEKINIVLPNLMKDVHNFDEFVSGVDALYLCEIICINSSYWDAKELITLCIERDSDLGTCPVMDFILEKLKINYKVNMKSINIKKRS